MELIKKIILNAIVEEHIKTSMPVGSGILVDKYKLDISPATARQRMAELEEENFIFQPHTSAGRIPTEKAYKLLAANIKNAENQNFFKNSSILKKTLKTKDEQSFKKTAKEMAQISNLAVFWAFHQRNLYYTGISNLLRQKEFSELSRVYDISVIIDEIDEIIDNIFNKINIGTHIFIGSKNPFGNFCSTIIAKYKRNDRSGMFGIIGPMRMDYQQNIALIKFIYKKINS